MDYQLTPLETVTSGVPEGPCRSDVLARLREIFHFMLSIYFRVMFMRLDFRFPSRKPYPPDNRIFVNFLESYRLHLKRQGADGCFLWIRERNPWTSIHHYHAAFLVSVPPGYMHPDDHEQWKRELFDRADSLWSRNLGLDPDIADGLVHHCDDPTPEHPLGNVVIIEKGDFQWVWKAHQCHLWSMYMAKTSALESLPPEIRSMGSSRVPSLPPASVVPPAPPSVPLHPWIELGLQRHWPTPPPA